MMSPERSSQSLESKTAPGAAAPVETDFLPGFGDVLYIIRERWAAGTAAGLLAAGVFAIYFLQQPPLYEAAASILVETTADKVMDIEKVVDTSLTGQRQLFEAALNSHYRQLTSRTLLLQVLETLAPEEKKRAVGPYLPDAPPPSFKRKAFLEDVVRESCQVQWEEGTQVFALRFRHRDAGAAALLANRYAAQYILFVLNRSGAGNDSALLFLRRQAGDLRGQIAEAESRLQAYREEHRLVSIEENQNIIQERLKSLNESATRNKVERLALESRTAQIETAQKNGGELLEIPAILQFGNVREILAELDAAQAERAAWSGRYLEKHPRMTENAARQAALRRKLDQKVQLAAADLRHQLAEVRGRQERIEAALRQAEAEALRLDRMAIDYNVLRRKLETDKSTFGQILTRLNETTISSRLDNTNIRILDQAQIPGKPVSPNPRKIILGALLLFGAAFFIVPLGLEMADNRLRTFSDIDRFLGKLSLGEVPEIKKREDVSLPLVMLEENDESLVELFRGLYSHLQIISKTAPPKVLLLTSTLPEEGKTFLSCNLAAAFSRHGHRTLLMDCDFRRPELHRTFKVKNTAGVLRWFDTGAAVPPPAEIAAGSELGILQMRDSFFFLRAGGSSKRPTEMMGHPRFEKLVHSLREAFDIVIIDTPPTGVFPDAFFLAEFADETVYVCRQNMVNRHRVKLSIQELDRTPAQVVGVILNGVSASLNRHGYYGRGYGYHSYGYYYGAGSCQKYYQRKEEPEPAPEKTPASVV